MARNFFRIDKGVKFAPQPSPPTSPEAGDAYYDSTTNSFRVYDGSSWITVDGGEVKTASNVGTGSQVFKQKTGANLEFRSLVAGTNISINQGANDITISSTGGGEANTASNVGTGSQVFKQKTGVNLEFRSIVAGSNVTITQNANDLTIDASGGELNFLQLSNVSWDAENGTAGFATYKDAAQSRPQDGTGGSPSVTITTSNTNPLSGNSSLIITKPSGNLQGEGVSVNFAVDRAARAKVLKVEFDYLVNSGTFNAGSNTADSDLIVYLYDVDASQLIEPSTFKLYSNASNIADKFSGYFQTSASSTNYRLIFHVATTNSSSWSLKVDNIVVTPSKYIYGTPITDWQEFIPTIEATTTNPNLGTGATQSGRWRRVGSDAEIIISITGGTGATTGSGIYKFPLPSGLSIDTSKIVRVPNIDANLSVFPHSGTMLGLGWWANNGIYTTGGLYVKCANNDTNKVILIVDGHTFNTDLKNERASALGSNTNNFLPFGPNITVDMTFKVPIQGWSSSVQMSDSVVWADDVGQIQAFAVPANNPPKGWLYADGSAVSRAVYSELFKKIGTTFGSGDGSTTFNLPDLRGIFIRGAGSQTFNSQTYNGTFGTKQNDAFKSHSHSINDPGHQHAMLMYNAPVDFNAGGSVYRVPYTTDGLGNVSVSGWSGTGITINATGGSETHPANISLTYFIKYTRGVSPIISMAETVTGFATNSSGQSIPNASFTAVTNWTVVNDTHGIFDPTTGVLTVNKSGFIEIASSLVFNPNASGGRSSAIERNGSNLTINDYPTVSGVTISVPISLASYPVKAGDTFKIKVFQSSGGNLSLAASSLYNYISWRIY